MINSTSANMRIRLADLRDIMEANKHIKFLKLGLASVLVDTGHVQTSFHLPFSHIRTFSHFQISISIFQIFIFYYL